MPDANIPKRHSLTFSDLASSRHESLQNHHSPGLCLPTCNARGALYQLLVALNHVDKKTILLPAYHCTVLVDPAIMAGYQVRYYRVTPELEIDQEDLQRQLAPDVLATVVIHYFGFPTDLQSVQQTIAASGSLLIEDCAHSFLTVLPEGQLIGMSGDFAIYSYYKLVPGLIGGSLVANRCAEEFEVNQSRLPFLQRQAIYRRLLRQATSNSPRNPISALLRGLNYLRLQGKKHLESRNETSSSHNDEFLDDPFLFDKQVASAGMPVLVRKIIESSDWQEIGSRYRRNYQALIKLLKEHAQLQLVFPELPDGVVPMALPVIFPERITDRSKLREFKIPFFTFGEPLHGSLLALDNQASKDAEHLSSRLILLPIHYQLDHGDMKSLVDLISVFLEETS